MVNNFFESKFGSKFCQKNVTQIKVLIDSSTSFTVVGMPGVGVTIFLKYLAITSFAHYIYVDSYLLTNLTKEEFFKLLLRELGEESLNEEYLFERCLYKLRELTCKYPRIVLIFNRFDQLHSIFDDTFFSNIWALRNVDPEKIVIISTVNTPLSETAPEVLRSEHRGVFSRVVYLKPFSVKDLGIIISSYVKSNLIENAGAIRLAQSLCGGHYQLLQLLLKSARLSNPLQDQFIKLQLKELYEFVNYRQRRVLRKIALGRKVTNEASHPERAERVEGSIYEYLLDIGMVYKEGGEVRLFTPLLGEYITRHHPKRLPIKEAKLFNLLKSDLGKVVSKEEIFNTLWPEEEQDQSLDWTLNSLIYRLKKNPAFLSSGFVIENHKKEGYILFKN